MGFKHPSLRFPVRKHQNTLICMGFKRLNHGFPVRKPSLEASCMGISPNSQKNPCKELQKILPLLDDRLRNSKSPVRNKQIYTPYWTTPS